MKVGTNKYKWQYLLVKPIAIGLLAGFASLFTSSAAYAACELNGDVELLPLGGRNMIIYWDTEDCEPDVVMYQTSSNQGKTWSLQQELVSSDVIAEEGFIEDFDGILVVGKRGSLAASFAVFADGDPKLKVVLSDNNGKDWGAPILAWDITDDYISGSPDFFHCPDLAATSIPASGVLSLLTTIIEGGVATAWIVTSRDSGLTWDEAIDLGGVPTTCDDD